MSVRDPPESDVELGFDQKITVFKLPARRDRTKNPMQRAVENCIQSCRSITKSYNISLKNLYVIPQPMSRNASSTEDPLLTQSSYSGTVFRLSSKEGPIDLKNITEELNGTKLYSPLPDKYRDNENLKIPEAFKTPDGSVNILTTINDTQYINRNDVHAVTGFIVIDDAHDVSYRDEQILILDTEKVRFNLIKENNEYYLVMVGRQNLVKNALHLIREKMEELNLLVSEAGIKPRSINKISDRLADKLIVTQFKGYPQPTIDGKDISGEGYGSEPEYTEEMRRGSVHAQMMSTRKIGSDGDKVLMITSDALVRSHNNMTLRTYLTLIQDHIIPHIDVQSTLFDYND